MNEEKPENAIQQVKNNLPTEDNLITDNDFLNYCKTAMDSIADAKLDAEDNFSMLFDHIINQGDATTATKEMATAFFDKKFKANDQMIKILELWSKLKLNDMKFNQSKTNIENQQNNFFNTNKRDLIEMTEQNIPAEKSDE